MDFNFSNVLYSHKMYKLKYNINEIWWIDYVKALQKYYIKKYDKSVKQLNKIKFKYYKAFLDMIYIRFRIFFKKIFKK